MGAIMKNWMTTVPGILALLNVAWKFYQTKTLSNEDITAVMVAFGLIGAKDYNVTGGDKQA